MMFPFVYNDAGRLQSKRSKQKNDCTVRALSLSAEVDYDIAYDLLKDRGRKSSKGHFFPKQRSDDIALGYKFIWKSFPAVKGQKRMNPERFAEEFPEGVYICRTAKHVYMVQDGVVHDIFKNRPDRCIYGCWKVVKI
jgi:hypothetical protein